MSRYLCIRLIHKLLQIFFFQGFKNRHILILLVSRYLTTYNQPTTLKLVNTQFQLENRISGIAFLVPKKNKSLLCINLKLQQNRDCSFQRTNSHFPRGNFFYSLGFMITYFTFSFNTIDRLLGLDDKANVVFCKFLSLHLDILFS